MIWAIPVSSLEPEWLGKLKSFPTFGRKSRKSDYFICILNDVSDSPEQMENTQGVKNKKLALTYEDHNKLNI